MKLHGYFRSSAAFRVRIALNLKKLDYESVSVHLRRGDQRQPGIPRRQPAGPRAGAGDRRADADPVAADHRVSRRDLSRAAAVAARCRRPGAGARAGRDRRLRHPSAQQSARAALSASARSGRTRRRLRPGTITGSRRASARSRRCSPATAAPARFCHGDTPGLADIALVPQVVNAERYRLDLAPYPTITRIFETCMKLDAFAAAHPGNGSPISNA